MANTVSTELICKSENDLKSAAEILLNTYPANRFFSFYGEMGAGKTTFIKHICESLQSTDVVNSPTFSIVNVYKTKNFNEIFHFDFYRLKSVVELYDIGYEDYFFSESYCFAEWPEKAESLLPENHVKVFIDVNHTDESRTIRF
jgi:tRNA threonylcarbamoyladenosine biosynthesis protein TsaE